MVGPRYCNDAFAQQLPDGSMMNMETSRLIGIIVIGAMLIGSVLPCHVESATITVSSGQSIQRAINRAENGDTIVIEPGIYRENLIVNRSLILSGSGGVVIDGMQRLNRDAITVQSEGVIIEHLEVRNASWAGINISSHGVVVRDCQLSQHARYGVLIRNANDTVIRDTVSSRNGGIGSIPGIAGIYLTGAVNSTLENVTANSNNLSGIHLSSSRGTRILGSTVENATRYGVLIRNSESTEVNGLTVDGCGRTEYGIRAENSSDNWIANSIVRGIAKHALHLYGAAGGAIRGNRIDESGGSLFAGICLEGSDRILVTRNRVSGCGYALDFASSGGGGEIGVHLNTFTGNLNTARISSSYVTWNASALEYGFSGAVFSAPLGNHWDAGSCAGADDDGVLNLPFGIAPGHEDPHPLACPDDLYLVPPPPDLEPPSPISDLAATELLTDAITWCWIDPPEPDLSHVEVWLDGLFRENVSPGTMRYRATGLVPDCDYTIAARTVDLSGNTNASWVNHTAHTLPAPPPPTTVPETTPPITTVPETTTPAPTATPVPTSPTPAPTSDAPPAPPSSDDDGSWTPQPSPSVPTPASPSPFPTPLPSPSPARDESPVPTSRGAGETSGEEICPSPGGICLPPAATNASVTEGPAPQHAMDQGPSLPLAMLLPLALVSAAMAVLLLTRR